MIIIISITTFSLSSDWLQEVPTQNPASSPSKLNVHSTTTHKTLDESYTY